MAKSKSKSTRPKSTPLPEKAPSPIAEIEQGPNKFEQFLDRNQRWLVIGGIVFVIIVLGSVAFRTIRQGQRNNAGAALVASDNLPALVDVIKNHDGTPAAESARLLSADALWKDNRQDESIAALRKFLSESPDHPAAPTARASLGSRLMVQGKYEEAKTDLQPLLDNAESRFLAPFALICLGEIARANGELDQAEEFLTRARDEFPENLFSSEATRHLLLLRAEFPVEVEPPPPPVPPAGSETTPPPLPDSSKLLRPKIPASPAKPAAPAPPAKPAPPASPAPPATKESPAPVSPSTPQSPAAPAPPPSEPEASSDSPSDK